MNRAPKESLARTEQRARLLALAGDALRLHMVRKARLARAALRLALPLATASRLAWGLVRSLCARTDEHQ